LADGEYLPETVQKVVLPLKRDVQFFKTLLLVHAKPLFFKPTASDTAGATANASHYHSRKKVSPDYENSFPLRDRLPMTKCRPEIGVPLRQNACNFWLLKKMHLNIGKK